MKHFFNLLMVIACTACAKPNYAEARRNQLNKTQGSICTLKFTQAQMCMTWTWLAAPTADNDGVMELRFASPLSAGEAALPADPPFAPFVYLWMPDMGHGSSPVRMEHVGTGIYRATNVFFSMPGLWEIHFQLRDGKKVIDEAVERVRI